MSYHLPDYSSSEDEFYDDFEYEDYVKERKANSNPFFNQLTEEQKKERQLRNFQFNVTNGKVHEVLMELDNGFPADSKLPNDWTPVLVAASIGNYDLVKILHERGADVKATRDGHTSLMLACSCPNTTTPFEDSAKVVELLLKLGLNPEAINRKRMNALMFAANNGNLHALKLLLPVTDIKVYDNQNWNALSWAVNGGNIQMVQYLMDQGLPYDRADVRGNTVIDIARDNNFDEIMDLFISEEDEDIINVNVDADFVSTFKDLKKGERPPFLLDIHKILYGIRCESLTKTFIENNANLLDFLSSTECDLKLLGVKMPFQRRRLMTGIHRLHKRTYLPKSLPTVGRNELYCNIDTAMSILSAVKQMISMEASLKYITKNINDCGLFSGDRDIVRALSTIEGRLAKLRIVTVELSKRAKYWDAEVEQVNVINEKSGRRWFPWRKTLITLGILIIGVSVGNRSFKSKYSC